MAGGTWSKLVGKERPGTYINFETTETNLVGISPRGTVIMPLLNYPYGPAEEFITIDNSSPDANYSKLGYSVYEKPLLLVKEALKCRNDDEAAQVGVEWCIAQCKELMAHGVPSLHFYTVSAVDSIARIAHNIY